MILCKDTLKKYSGHIRGVVPLPDQPPTQVVTQEGILCTSVPVETICQCIVLLLQNVSTHQKLKQNSVKILLK